MGEFNIAPNTQIGKIIIAEKIYDNENTYHTDMELYSRSGEFIDNMSVDNIIEFCHRWFKLANITDFIKDIDEFYNNRSFGRFSTLASTCYNLQGTVCPILPTVKGPVSPIEFGRDHTKAFVFNNKLNEDMTYQRIISDYKR